MWIGEVRDRTTMNAVYSMYTKAGILSGCYLSVFIKVHIPCSLEGRLLSMSRTAVDYRSFTEPAATQFVRAAVTAVDV